MMSLMLFVTALGIGYVWGVAWALVWCLWCLGSPNCFTLLRSLGHDEKSSWLASLAWPFVAVGSALVVVIGKGVRVFRGK